jgi:hypothetical protein
MFYSIGWARHVACKGEMHKTFWLKNMKGRYHFEDLDVNGKMVLFGV